ncbi:MAG: DUF1565 domain-containing protein [Leptolyngbyaceae cyanobacterium CRU_2_3]|nr:DUF1565 domain-containing protein [Leptolyngbyaceae cyanobacterium CRU_2_3]
MRLISSRNLLPSRNSLFRCKSGLAIATQVCGIGLTLLTTPGLVCEQAIAQSTVPQSTVPQSSTADIQSPTSQRLLYVNPAIGNDQGNGSETMPFRTITQALRVATPQTIILLAAGTYSPETGEIFRWS